MMDERSSDDDEEELAASAEEEERAVKEEDDPYPTPPTLVESVASPSSPATPTYLPPKVTKEESGKVALRYRCSECHKDFKNQGALTRHWRDTHSELGATPRPTTSKTKKQTGSGIIFYPASSKR